LPLRFATIGVNQLSGGSSRKPNIWPALCRVAGLDRRANHSRGDELVEAARSTLRLCARRNELGDHSAVRRNGDTLSRLNSPYVAAQVVFEFADACGGHQWIIATCGHMHKRLSPWLRIATLRRPTDAVPNSVAVGPDDAYYVGELTGGPFVPETANVWRVVPGRAPQVYCSGFSFIIDLDFDRRGNLYVFEHTSAPSRWAQARSTALGASAAGSRW
jgi:hypothetical protein